MNRTAELVNTPSTQIIRLSIGLYFIILPTIIQSYSSGNMIIALRDT